MKVKYVSVGTPQIVDAGDGDGTARLFRTARDLLQQPGAERVDLPDPGEVDAQALGLCKLRRGGVEQALQQIGVEHRPRSGGTEFERIADSGDVEQRDTQCCRPSSEAALFLGWRYDTGIDLPQGQAVAGQS